MQIYTYICIYVYTYIYTCICVSMLMYVYTCINMEVYVRGSGKDCQYDQCHTEEVHACISMLVHVKQIYIYDIYMYIFVRIQITKRF
jgi:hypothetical protein